ncbi:MAG: SNF2-related protein, partial [Thermoproteus sp.]
GLGAILADDMGLGKTVQAIAYILGRGRGPSLIICPTSIVGNWRRELERFAPSLRVMVHHGPSRLSGEEFAEEARRHSVVLSTYSLLPRDIDALSRVEWDVVVLDEAQNVKNPWTKQAQAARRLRARHRVALTGTPVENRLSELWSIMDFLNPGYLGSQREFRRNFELPIERYNDRSRARVLHRLVEPFVLRRRKEDRDVIDDLPDKFEAKVYVN